MGKFRIKRCPCCRSAALLYCDDISDNYPYYVACTHCFFSGPPASFADTAVKLWNLECET